MQREPINRRTVANRRPRRPSAPRIRVKIVFSGQVVRDVPLLQLRRSPDLKAGAGLGRAAVVQLIADTSEQARLRLIDDLRRAGVL